MCLQLYRLIFLFSFVLVGNLFPKEVVEISEPVEDVNFKVLEFLNTFTDNSVKSIEKTDGFNYHYRPYFWSPYRFQIYVGRYSKKTNDSLIRIEAPRSGEAKVYRSILEQTFLPNKVWDSPPIPIYKKQHFIYQPVNLLSPSLGILYSGYSSPFYLKDEMILKAVLYFFIDLAIVGTFAIIAENTKKTKSVQDRLLLQPGQNNLNLLTGKYAGPMFAILAIPRLIRSIDGYYEIATQNRFVELGYTFRF
jgi:hypothetical protein